MISPLPLSSSSPTCCVFVVTVVLTAPVIPVEFVLVRDLVYSPLVVISTEKNLHTVLLGACDPFCVTDLQAVSFCSDLSLGCNLN